MWTYPVPPQICGEMHKQHLATSAPKEIGPHQSMRESAGMAPGRGRDASYPTPPAQIPACGTTAPGSCLGSDVQGPEGACRTRSGTCDRDGPALCPVPAMLRRVPLGQLPSLHLLRRSLCATFVRRLPRYYEAVRLPTPVHHGRAPWVHRADLIVPRQARGRASRVPRSMFLCMPEVSDPARSVQPSLSRSVQCSLPRVRSASAPRLADFGAPYSACTFPCQRFANAVTDACA